MLRCFEIKKTVQEAWFIFRYDYFSLSILKVQDSLKLHCPDSSIMAVILSQWGGRWGHFTRSLLDPRLEVLESVEGGVMHTERIRRHWFAHGLLEGVGLKLKQHPIGLLTSCLSFLSCLPSGDFEVRLVSKINKYKTLTLWSNSYN